MTIQSEESLTIRPPWGKIIAGVAVAAVAAFAGIYGLERFGRNPGDPICRPTIDLAHRIAPLARGELAAVKPAEQARKIPVLAFNDASGRRMSLADWHGRTVLLNLWATWCVPCRKEMPALDALQAKLAGPDFDVVAVNIDTRDPEKPKNWLHDVGVGHLAYYSDPEAKVFQDLKSAGKAFGMPTTLLVDPNGCEIASLAGPAEWASPDAIGLVTAALGK